MAPRKLGDSFKGFSISPHVTGDAMIPKRKFTFTQVSGKVDLYLDGKKVVSNHRGSTGNYYFRIPEDTDIKLDVAEHDSNIPIEATVGDDGLELIERKPKFVPKDVNLSKEEVAKAIADKIRADRAAVIKLE